MSAPPIGMISRKPRAIGEERDQPEHDLAAAGGDEARSISSTSRMPSAGIELVLVGEGDRRALHQRLQLGEGDERAGEGDGADGQAERHLDQALRVDIAGRADAERFRRIQRRGGDEHRGEADQRVERRDQLRQRRHLDAPGDERADAAADGDAEQDQQDAAADMPGCTQRRQDGDRHAGHAEQVAAARGLGVGQAAQRQDEQDGGDQIQQRGQGLRT